MSYHNTVSVKVINIPIVTKEQMLCPKCKLIDEDGGKFCKEDGESMIPHNHRYRLKDSIRRLKEVGQSSAYLLSNDGSSTGEGSGDAEKVCDELKKFSKNYPDGIWEVNITWTKDLVNHHLDIM
jgi:hypothetical protein